MWVDGVVRVVCGLSEDTSCQDVVIALAQAIGECVKLSAEKLLWHWVTIQVSKLLRLCTMPVSFKVHLKH